MITLALALFSTAAFAENLDHNFARTQLNEQIANSESVVINLHENAKKELLEFSYKVLSENSDTNDSAVQAFSNSPSDDNAVAALEELFPSLDIEVADFQFSETAPLIDVKGVGKGGGKGKSPSKTARPKKHKRHFPKHKPYRKQRDKGLYKGGTNIGCEWVK